ncbi:hypothetical protein D9613_004867 [Agrocybe pediades]|uniref:Uncharacterized protein n=1 Tax=Agrocybe pediades TaxID=84607 RepID=A0A8H4VRA6_9AGAR|nr:hypothetical protein D9613_004867 [Agrocybe pediades]KAF9562445.1 hypothetical protein CPC08DRAFT_761426 [Agrocybe pediades]
MRFNLVILAIFAASAAMARPSGTTQNDESAEFKSLLANSPAQVGHQAAENDPVPPGCYWDGIAPFCDGNCPPGYVEKGRKPCGFAGYSALCCRVPDSSES